MSPHAVVVTVSLTVGQKHSIPGPSTVEDGSSLRSFVLALHEQILA